MRVSELLNPNEHEFSFTSLEMVLLKLAGDEAAEVRGAVARTMAGELSKTDSLTRTRVVSEWALSPFPSVRDTIARTLSTNFDCLGSAAAAEHLSIDPNPEVRAAVVNVAVARHRENPAHYQAILHHLSADQNRRVRHAARRAEATLS